MKAVVLLSKTFFPQHPKAGEKTDFRSKIANSVVCKDCDDACDICEHYGSKGRGRKIHTCRKNYAYWQDKIDRLKEVGGVLSVRQWTGNPYRSTQERIIDIPAKIVGVQKLTIEYGKQKFIPRIDNEVVHLPDLARNDGLDTYDFIDWFKPVFEKEKKEILEFAIIHFTDFRY
jgi:hypothetical protein